VDLAVLAAECVVVETNDGEEAKWVAVVVFPSTTRVDNNRGAEANPEDK
jgi:hypothetical protein